MWWRTIIKTGSILPHLSFLCSPLLSNFLTLISFIKIFKKLLSLRKKYGKQMRFELIWFLRSIFWMYFLFILRFNWNLELFCLTNRFIRRVFNWIGINETLLVLKLFKGLYSIVLRESQKPWVSNPLRSKWMWYRNISKRFWYGINVLKNSNWFKNEA
jgi:hypothetical protein